ncbi:MULTISPECIES: antibiotic biosynthesis monooxygenase [unclassified Epibacterium]|jgi:hypothetical protein|uniref:antibiotic biosynthesis monooxygenase n=1 Tax=unclassified Epibacterium TaxID=2639179 RepID=UPI001EF3E0E6|nr:MULTISPECIES: antibiotic biosynthesis monooxygenase [unclassified Epibacterium]MCG7622467.1 antibiotic biosynthesis monooxygenase [Epibacterium sp. Ofav1-8]MCG7628431.1 antibiotic biosynthesis monooxygenase [Epibacterium sp. MM17-32]
MIAVITKYYPLRDKFDEVLDCAAALARDESGRRVGCYETRLFAARESGEIKSISLWHSQQVFEDYLDAVVSGDDLMEFQSTYLRREIDTQVYETVDTELSASLASDMAPECRTGT